MLLTLQLEPFSPYTPKHFVHGEVPIQLQGLWHWFILFDYTFES